jgi:iron complex outermembrane receptor protein
MNRIRLLTAATGWLICAACPATVFAAQPSEAQDDSTNDIVVTARKRDENLIDVPVAVSALSNGTLERRRITTLTDIATAVPNVTIAKQASGSGVSLSIRGIGSTFNDPGIDQTVLINVDGAALSRGFISSIAFFDVAQVEILKGPQALFFGKNSPAGVVSIRSIDPGSSFEGYARTGYEFDARERYIEGALSGPLSNTLSARLAIRYDKAAGYLTNRAQPGPNPYEPDFPLVGGNGRVPGDETITGRATLLWKPSDRFSANLKVLANHYTDKGLINALQAVRCGSTVLPTVQGIADPTGDCRPDTNNSIGNLPAGIAAGFPGARDGKAFSNIDSYLATLNVQYNLDTLKFTTLTSYNYNDLLALGFFDATSFARQAGLAKEHGTGWSQEIRLGSDFDGAVNFVVGGYYEYSRRRVGLLGRVFSAPFDPATGYDITTDREGLIKGTSVSAFAQFIWNISDQIELAGGARLSHEKKDTEIQNAYVNPANVATNRPQGLILADRFSGTNLSPEVTLTWHPVKHLTIYAAYKTGYKAGGASFPTSIPANLTKIGFGPERTKGGELGFKGALLDRRLTFSSALYSYRITGLQLVRLESLPDGTLASIVSNAARARVRGFEAETSFRASNVLTLRGSVSYNDAKLTSFTGAPCYQGQTAALGCTVTGGVGRQDRSGDPLSKAPKWTWTSGFDVNVPVSDYIVGLSTDAKYSSSYRTQDDGAPYARQAGFVLLDAALRLRTKDDHWELGLIGKNLTNKFYLMTTSPRPGGLPGDLYGPIGRPRTVAIQGTARF